MVVREEGFISFTKAFAWSETHTTSTWIWSQVTDSLSNDDNRYVYRTSIEIH